VTELIGWLSSGVLLLTIGRQVLTQWRTHTTAGLSRWLFIGQLTASAGFTVYSLLLHNWVFVVTNIAMLVTAICGQVIYLRNRHRGGASARAA
jgi:uncharacterized protein with PQ loop repeat